MSTQLPPLALRLLAPPARCTSYQSSLRTRLFSTTSRAGDNTVNHYNVLNLPTNCSQAELKQQFYALSKQNHPDINPNNPQAADRFKQISESYSVLGNPDKRKKYDRDHVHTRPSTPYGYKSSAHGGSFAGSRPPSGLSKRRSAFRGPPPSYYAHGSPSANTARNASGAQTSSGNADAPAGAFHAGAYTSNGAFDPYFDHTKIFRTQTQEDARRLSRRQAAMARAQEQAEDESGFWTRFVVVGGIVFVGVAVAAMAGGLNNPKGGLNRADGSRRNGRTNDWAKG